MDHENRKRAFLIKAVLPTVALAALAGAAWWAFSRQPPAPFDIAAEPRVAIEKGKELRDGWRLAEPAIVNLGPAPEDGVLRLGFFDAGADDGWLKPKSSFEVRVGGALFAEERLDASPGWRDYRIELPNGLSGDCTVAFRPAQEFLLSHCEAFTEEENPRTAFVFLIDALRLDHMSCYGYERETTPNITAFAKDAVRFTQLLPSSSWTRPSVASLLTSMYPEAHGAQDRPDVMRSGMPSLAGRLRAAGFETLGFMSNPNCLPKWGFGDGFARYINVNSYRWWSALDEEVIDSVLEALPYEEGRSRFMYIHTMAPHEPYVPPEPYETMFGDPEALSQPKKNICLYDGEIAYIDAQFARFVNALKEAGLYDQSLIVLLSDHGQGLRTHGKAGHGNSLYEELVRVPLFVKLPDNAHGGETRHGLVEMVDIAPTVMELLGMAPGPGFAGKSFAGVVDGAQEGKPVGYASLRLGKHDMRTAKTPALKYIQNITRSREQWFDLVRDPGERSPMDAPPGEAAQALAAHVAEMEMRGSAGLHILATPSPDRDIEVSGSLGGPA
jgi:arylsulfatase A-like enzyme